LMIPRSLAWQRLLGMNDQPSRLPRLKTSHPFGFNLKSKIWWISSFLASRSTFGAMRLADRRVGEMLFVFAEV
jgi:hypothetical protein